MSVRIRVDQGVCRLPPVFHQAFLVRKNRYITSGNGDLLGSRTLLRFCYINSQYAILHAGLHAILINRMRERKAATEFARPAL